MPQSYTQIRHNNFVILYMNELTHRVVASTGNPEDRFHLGKIILQSLKDAPDFLLQVDGALDQSETCGSVLDRSVRCAVALKNLGIKYGDIVALIAPNHLDLVVPFYAALYIGAVIAGVDISLNAKELATRLDVFKPKVIFCHNDKVKDTQEALNTINEKAHIITFDDGDRCSNFNSFLKNNVPDSNVKEFKPADFDPENTIAVLTTTSGTTGLPKSPALSHKNIAINYPYFFSRRFVAPPLTRLMLFFSPIQWLTTTVIFILSPILRYTRLQTSAPATTEHIYYLINKYKPSALMMSPTKIASMLSTGESHKCDFSCLDIVYMGGSFVSQKCIDSILEIAPKVDIQPGYGLTEAAGRPFLWDDYMPPGCIGQPIGHLRHRLVDPDSFKDIKEPYVTGEIWIKGPTIFKGYYNNPEETKEVFSKDGWLKTGDLMYRDEQYNYFYVDRLKTLLKYKQHRISPIELEKVIHSHPAVNDVVVVGIPSVTCGDLATACVVRRVGHNVTAHEIKEFVKENLPASKHLHGGVVFMQEIPLTATTKIDRIKVKSLVMKMERE